MKKSFIQRRRPGGTRESDGRPIRLYVIDDDKVHILGIETLLRTNPKNDIVLVGSAHEYTPDLPIAVSEATPDVVLVDGQLDQYRNVNELASFPESDGLTACSAIRKKLQQSVKIVLYTGHQELILRWRQMSDFHRADYFVVKEWSGEEFRQMIRDVHAGTYREILHNQINEIFELRLILGDSVLAMRDCSGKQVKVKLRHDVFPFLHYLALERQEGKSQWVAQGEALGRWMFTQPSLWRQIVEDSGYTHRDEGGFDESEFDAPIVRGWATLINKRVRHLIVAHDPHPRLVWGPPPGRRAEVRSNYSYTLCPTVKKILIEGKYRKALIANAS